MSYLQNKSGTPSFKEAIISFWFRVPGQTLDATSYDYNADPSPVFNGIIPLLVMGKEGREDGLYDYNATPVVRFVTDFKSQGPFYDTYAEYIGEECLSYNDFFFIYFFHCCLTATRTTRYTAVKIGDGQDYHDEAYGVVYAPTPHEVQKSNPTCIGVDANGNLYVNFQTNQQPEIGGDEGYEFVTSITPGSSISTSGNMGYSEGDQVTSITYSMGLLGCVGLVDTATTTGPTVHPGIDSTGTYTPADEQKTTFPPLPYETGKFFSGGYETGWSNNIKVSPDHWHHVLVSVKLRTTQTHAEEFASGQSPHGFAGGSLLYVALDDKNYTKNDLSNMWDWGSDDGESSVIGDNEVYPDTAWDIATDYYRPEGDYPQETYNLTDPEVPAGTIGLPATDEYVDSIKQVELAELQIWFGKSMNTGSVSNRRLFIDSKGKPVKPEIAAEALGKPDILLHGSSNWKKGINKGALAPPPDPDKPPEPWFNPTPPEDGIERWKPDPSLYGPQRPSDSNP